jgi:ribonuclease III
MPKSSLRYDFAEFEAKVDTLLTFLQILPKNKRLYQLACTHRSVLNESHQWYTESNERLEYLGDAVLEVVITEALFHEFPKKTE